MNEETKRLFFLTFFFVLVEGLHLYKNEEDDDDRMDTCTEGREGKGERKEWSVIFIPSRKPGSLMQGRLLHCFYSF